MAGVCHALWSFGKSFGGPVLTSGMQGRQRRTSLRYKTTTEMRPIEIIVAGQKSSGV